MLTEICAEIKNYFSYEKDRLFGDWRIVDGQITPSIEFPTEYYRIVGSRCNDGVHHTSDILVDEDKFHGAIWIMCIPPDFLALVDEITFWQNSYGHADSVAMSPYQSESFGGYSYAKSNGGSGSGTSGQNGPTWQSQYANRLNIYRKLREI